MSLPFTLYALPLWLLLILTGVCLASFGNVLIYRIPRRESFLRGRSHCTACGETLRARDMVPLVSWLALGRRCRHCRAPISPRYAVNEALGGLLAFVTVWRYGLSWAALCVFFLLFGLLIIAWIDWDTMEIPDGMILFLLAPALGLLFCMPGVGWAAHAIGIASVALPLLIFALIIEGSFGGGDIKMMAVCGLAIGWKLNLFALFIALLLGGIYAAVLLLRKKKKRKQHIPFAPCLAAGVAAAVFFGEAAMRWYFGLFF